MLSGFWKTYRRPSDNYDITLIHDQRCTDYLFVVFLILYTFASELEPKKI